MYFTTEMFSVYRDFIIDWKIGRDLSFCRSSIEYPPFFKYIRNRSNMAEKIDLTNCIFAHSRKYNIETKKKKFICPRYKISQIKSIVRNRNWQKHRFSNNQTCIIKSERKKKKKKKKFAHPHGKQVARN